MFKANFVNILIHAQQKKNRMPKIINNLYINENYVLIEIYL